MFFATAPSRGPVVLALLILALQPRGAPATPQGVSDGAASEETPATAAPLLRPYRANYFVISPETGEARFQLSIMIPLLAEKGKRVLGSGRLHFAYTQTSFWDTGESSAPFRESDYNPELFLEWKGTKGGTPGWSLKRVQVGVAHESNGRAGDASRGWNSVYLEPRIAYRKPHRPYDTVEISVRVWPVTHLAPENPDLLDYFGHGELGAVLRRRKIELSLSLRAGSSIDRGGALVGVRLKPHHLKSSYVLLQGWSGYGESLLNYDVKTSHVRIGFVLAP